MRSLAFIQAKRAQHRATVLRTPFTNTGDESTHRRRLAMLARSARSGAIRRAPIPGVRGVLQRIGPQSCTLVFIISNLMQRCVCGRLSAWSASETLEEQHDNFVVLQARDDVVWKRGVVGTHQNALNHSQQLHEEGVDWTSDFWNKRSRSTD